MSIFRIKIVACNPKNEQQTTTPLEVLVDTSSDLTWLPGEMLRRIGLKPRGKRSFRAADEVIVERRVGRVILRANGYETAGEVVFGEPGDAMVVGAQALEGFGMKVDNSIANRFVPLTAMASFWMHTLPQRAASLCL